MRAAVEFETRVVEDPVVVPVAVSNAVLGDVAPCGHETPVGRRERLQVVETAEEGDLGEPAKPWGALGSQVVEDVAARYLGDPPGPIRALVKRVVLELCHGPSVTAFAAK